MSSILYSNNNIKDIWYKTLFKSRSNRLKGVFSCIKIVLDYKSFWHRKSRFKRSLDNLFDYISVFYSPRNTVFRRAIN